MPGEIPAPVRAVYRERGIEAMRENAEWVAVYRRRPAATPTCSLARQRASPKIQFCPKFV
jgi:hypothetical protein